MAKRKTHPPPPPDKYLHRTHRPLNCFALIFPLLLIYEIGAVFYRDRLDAAERLSGPQDLGFLLGLFGATSPWLPPLLIVVTILAWHVGSRDKWHIDAAAVAGMIGESALWMIPLVGLNHWAARYLGPAPLSAAGAWVELPTAVRVVRGIGAGVYEEFFFRLGAIALVMFGGVDILRRPRKWVVPVAVVASSVLFGLYHLAGAAPPGVDAETFRWGYVVFGAIAGVYLAVVYIARGFGVAVGTHAAYNILMAVW